LFKEARIGDYFLSNDVGKIAISPSLTARKKRIMMKTGRELTNLEESLTIETTTVTAISEEDFQFG